MKNCELTSSPSDSLSSIQRYQQIGPYDMVAKTLVGLLSIAAAAILISNLWGKRLNSARSIHPPPRRKLAPNRQQLRPPRLHKLRQEIRPTLPFENGQRNIAVISSIKLAREVLLTKGKEFRSRSRNIVFDIFTSKGQDMVFAKYGDHWAKMWWIVLVPFSTKRVGCSSTAVSGRQRGQGDRETK
ncbi:UNVERIFIED_CONTAM: Trans-cinnamate 4-monooxygenase [Sesamum radiatum]|uniref:Trans-cinnamate 4-monooxygenase n=1 Tax=Sesamum radiatum TaxID=300843 RepID=A0AAW2QI73_SESRA